jgi:hypothetical protein
MNAPRHPTYTSKKEPMIDADALAEANRRWAADNGHAILCLAPAPPNYVRGMPSDLIWSWHRAQDEAKGIVP